MRAKLTTSKIDRLEPESKMYYVWSEQFPGLAVRVMPSGAKTFAYKGRVGGKQKLLTIGRYPIISLQDAIERVSELNKQMVAGIDPDRIKAENIQKNKAIEQANIKNDIIFGDAFTHYFNTKKHGWSANYITDHIKACMPHLSAVQPDSYTLGCLALLWHQPLRKLSAEYIEAWLLAENQKRKTVAARAYRMYRAFVNWANERNEYAGVIPERSATAKIVTSSVAKTGRHKHSLQRQQLKLWFDVINTIHPVHKKALICMLLNGSRPEEMLSLKWGSVDFNWNTITIIDKVDQWERTIPLTPYVKYLLMSMPRKSEYIFVTDKSTSYTHFGDTYRYAVRDAGLPPLPPKAMRKSFSNLSEWLAVPYGIVKQIMGHRPSATDEKHYKDRPIDLLRYWHTIIEYFILSEAGVDLSHVYAQPIDIDKYIIDADSA